MNKILESLTSKKLGASPDVVVAGLAGALLAYVLPQAYVDRGKVLAQAAIDQAKAP